MKITSFLIEAHIFRKINNEIEFLLMKRSDKEIHPYLWQMVTGTIRDGEKAYQTALREIKEETGMVPQKFWIVPFVNSFYSHEKDEVIMVPVFACIVDSNAIVKISEEHSEFKWVNKEEAKKLLAWKGQRESVETIYEYFTMKSSLLKFIEIKVDKNN